MSPHRDPQGQGTCDILPKGPCAAPSPGPQVPMAGPCSKATWAQTLTRQGCTTGRMGLSWPPKTFSWFPKPPPGHPRPSPRHLRTSPGHLRTSPGHPRSLLSHLTPSSSHLAPSPDHPRPPSSGMRTSSVTPFLRPLLVSEPHLCPSHPQCPPMWCQPPHLSMLLLSSCPTVTLPGAPPPDGALCPLALAFALCG